MSCLNPVSCLRAFVQKRRKEKLRCDWLAQRAKSNCSIEPDIEFVGQYPPYPFISIDGPCRMETDISVWIADQKDAKPELKIGSDVFIGRNSYLGVYQSLTIGNSVMIGAYSYITTANHDFKSREIPMSKQGFTSSPIKIESDVWIGAHCVVLPGVTIGTGSILAAGSVLNQSIPPYEIWGGVPAKKLKDRP